VERTGLDTPAVLAINDGESRCSDVFTLEAKALSQTVRPPSAIFAQLSSLKLNRFGTHSVPNLGSMVARLKLKGIDGGRNG